MKSREQKQKDLEALTEQLSNSKSAVIVSFTNLTVNKDQEIRSELREAGAKYQVVKNTLARLAVKGTPYEEATEHFKGVTAIAWTDDDEPVDLSKAVSKFIKENSEIFTFKTGIVEGKVVNFDKIKEIASLPSKDELIGKFLYLLNAPAQRLATVLSAIPRDLAVVLQQVSEGKGELQTAAEKAEPKEEAKAVEEEPKAEEPKAEEPKAEEPKAEEAKPEEKTAEEPKSEESAEAETTAEPAQETAEKIEAPADEATDKSEAEAEPKQEAETASEAEAPEEKAADDSDEKEKAE